MAEVLTAKPTAAPTPAAPAAAPERRVSVKLLHDVWIDDPGHPDAKANGIRRVRTNIVSLNEDGSPMIDRKTRNYVSTQVVVDLPISAVKKLLAEGKAERMDPL